MKLAFFGIGLALLGTLGGAQARSVVIGGSVQATAVDSRALLGGEMLAVWTLPRLGVSVRNDPQDLRLQYGGRELRYAPEGGWQSVGFKLGALPLPPPQSVNGSLYVPLTALKLLGIRIMGETPSSITFAPPAVVPTNTLPPSLPISLPAPTPVPPKPVITVAPVAPMPLPTPSTPTPNPTTPTPTPEPAPVPQPAQPVANLNTVRVSRTVHRNIEVQRVVLELSGPAGQTVSREHSGLSILLPAVSASPVTQTLGSGDTLSVTPSSAGATVRLSTGGGSSEIFTLDNPARVVIDTTTLLDSSVPPPIDPENLPAGVSYWEKGMLHLLSFDPAAYQARVVSAPTGRSSDLASLVKSVRGVGGVNGGYFDTGSALPVDLVVQGGLMTAPSLERRATVGFSSSGEPMFGYPRPRYVLTGPFGSVTVNTVGAKVRRDLLTAFVGDGRTAVGADDLTTLYVRLGGGSIDSALTGRVTPPAGQLTLTFDPAKFPQLPRGAGQALNAALTWRADDAPWNSAWEALSAGPLLVSGGKVALNPTREKFDTDAGIWRATRQVALGTFGGKPTIAYFDYGTPESFAAALAGAGVRDAVRMDSGSSATVYMTGGYANLGGYLNTVWSQNVPNAIVFVPKAGTVVKK